MFFWTWYLSLLLITLAKEDINSLVFLTESPLLSEDQSGLHLIVNQKIVGDDEIIVGKTPSSITYLTNNQGYPAVTTSAKVISNRGSFICFHSTHNQTLIVEKKFILPDWDSHGPSPTHVVA